MKRVFFSYSREDEALRDELEKHLAVLKKEGSIDVWYDRRILAGDRFDGVINAELERADIILLLISPNFINSNYCFDIEMKRALERDAAGEAKVIPVILETCDWKNTQIGNLLALPKDGKPISKYTNANDAFLEVVNAIRKAAVTKKTGGTSTHVTPTTLPRRPATPLDHEPRSGNLRVRKEFTDRDRDTFLDDAFEYMGKFFVNSLGELEKRNVELATNFKQIDAHSFSAIVYKNGKQVTQCLVSQGGASTWGKGIYFSHSVDRGTGGFNESLSVRDDGHILYLEPMGMSFRGHLSDSKTLTQEGASEYYWSLLIDPLQH